jgi:hypothetical protein
MHEMSLETDEDDACVHAYIYASKTHHILLPISPHLIY